MQFKVLIALALASVATAVPTGGLPAPIPASQCNTGPVQCCDSLQTAGAPAVASLLTALGVAVQDVNVPVGVTCSPISVIGVPGNSCSAQAVCCERNGFNGVVAIGCTPVDLNL